MDTKIWLSSPHMGGGEMKYIQQAFDENWVAPLGPNVNGFEQDLEDFLQNGAHVAALSSGTGALHLALVLLDVHAHDEVICQSLTFSASANPIKYLNANALFVDSERDTWNLCPNAVEDAIKKRLKTGKKPKVIIAVDLYGMPYKINDLRSISKRYEIPIIEDAAEALGSTFKGKKCGTFGDISILSFNGNKIITTSGGGALIVKKKEYKKKAVFLSTQARDDAPHYEHTNLGYNYRMSNICAGIGRGQMEVINDRVAQRRANHDFYEDLFQEIPGVTVLKEPNGDYFSNRWLSVITIDPQSASLTREELRLALHQENIESRPIWKPMHLQPVFKKERYYGGKIAESIFNNGLCLPSGSNLTDDDRSRIAENILNTFKKVMV